MILARDSATPESSWDRGARQIPISSLKLPSAEKKRRCLDGRREAREPKRTEREKKIARQRREGSEPPNRFKMRCSGARAAERESALWGKPMEASFQISNGGLNSSDTQGSCWDTHSKHPRMSGLKYLRNLSLGDNNALESNLQLNPNTWQVQADRCRKKDKNCLWTSLIIMFLTLLTWR